MIFEILQVAVEGESECMNSMGGFCFCRPAEVVARGRYTGERYMRVSPYLPARRLGKAHHSRTESRTRRWAAAGSRDKVSLRELDAEAETREVVVVAGALRI